MREKSKIKMCVFCQSPVVKKINSKMVKCEPSIEYEFADGLKYIYESDAVFKILKGIEMSDW